MDWRRKHSPERAFRRVRGFMNAALVFVIAVSLAACTDRPATEDEFAADTVGGLTDDTTGFMTQDHSMQEDTVNVELVAFEIDMPETLPAGETVFEVENTGEMEHGFEIELLTAEGRGMQGQDQMEGEQMEGQGVEGTEGQATPGIGGQETEWSIDSLQPGDSETLTANLQPGTYTVYCPVGNHREQGMEMTITVEEDAQGTTAQLY